MAVPVALILVISVLGACAVPVQNGVANTESKNYDTIVVGLGSSGVTAASTLARAGRRVLGIEAQNRIGGRVNTVPFGDGVVELGAEWIHGIHSSRTYDLAIQNNVSVVPQNFTYLVYRSDGTMADQNLVTELLDYCHSVLEGHPETPEAQGQYITRKLTEYITEKKPDLLNDNEFIDQILELMNQSVNGLEGSNDWNDVSTWSKYETLEGHQYYSWHRNGYKTFFDILLNKYNNGPGLPTLDIKLDTEVTQVKWSQDPSERVTVTCKDGTTYTADNVIVTVSVGVLKERHSTLFSQPLPQDKITAIETTSMGLVDKIIFTFSDWEISREVSYAFLWRPDDKKKVDAEDFWITKIAGTSSPMGCSNTITLWLTGNSAKKAETLSDDVVQRKSLWLLRKFLGANMTIPEPTAMLRTSWFSNPFTRGSYTYDNVAVAEHLTARADLARPLLDSAGTPRVLFAGEATDVTHFSTVHGASDSGYREARRLLPDASEE